MDDEVELISDGDGLAVIGNPTAVERFMASVGLSSSPGSPRLGAAFNAGASIAQTGSEIAANSGRWVKLTEESAQKIKQFGLTPTKTPGVSHAMVGDPGGRGGDHGAAGDATADGRHHRLPRHHRREARQRPSLADQPGAGPPGR